MLHRVAIVLLALSFMSVVYVRGTPAIRAAKALTPVSHYPVGLMERVVIPNHQNPERAGDYVPGFRVKTGLDCFTAVRWADRWMVGRNVVVVAEFRNPQTGEWIEERCQVTDWQKRHDATEGQRFELNGAAAQRLGFYGWFDKQGRWRGWGRTVARVIRYER